MPRTIKRLINTTGARQPSYAASPSLHQRRDALRSVKLARKLYKVLSAAYPGLPQKVRSSLAVDLSDIEEVGRKHRHFIKRLFSLRFPRDSEKAENLFIDWIDVELLFHNQWHLKSLKGSCLAY